MYRDIYNLKICGAIFFNHESERRPDEYVSRKITRSVARIYYGKQKKLVLGNVKIKIDWGYAKDYVEAAYKICSLKKMIFILLVVEKKRQYLIL